jgi:hypothetical protein
MAGKFSCSACGKTYSWKPELAGKRVKCKCGQPISIPASDPAGADDIGDLGALAALSEGDPMTPGAVAGGPTCPGCGSGVDPSAVLCVNCGQNLKTGKKLKTSKVAVAAGGGGAADTYAPGYRSYGAVNSEEGMTDKQKKMVIFSSIGGIAAVVLIIIFVVLPARAVKKRREAQIDARPAKLEHALTAMEESGGLVGAMKDGTLVGGGSPKVGVGTAVAGVGGDPDAPPAVPPGYAFNERIQGLLNQSQLKVGKKFLMNPKAKFLGKTREQTEKLINDLYGMKCPSVQVLMAPPDMYTGDEQASGVVVVLPEDKAERTKVFAYYHTIEGTIEPIDMEPQTDKGQKWLAIELRDPRGKR